MSIRKLALIISVFLLVAGLGFTLELNGTKEKDKAKAKDNSVSTWRLPAELREISGLAHLADSRLVTMTDESGLVHAFSYSSSEILPLIEVGPPGDYEGIEYANQMLYLITSDGKIWYSSLDGKKRGDFDTGLRKTCEVEGLHSHNDTLLVLCKAPYEKQQKNRILIFTFDPSSGSLAPFLNLPNPLELQPSGIASDAEHLYVIAAEQKMLLVLNFHGEVVSRHSLKGHRQAEGIAVLPDGRIAIADEGKKKGGFITLYPSLTDIGE